MSLDKTKFEFKVFDIHRDLNVFTSSCENNRFRRPSKPSASKAGRLHKRSCSDERLAGKLKQNTKLP